MHTSTNNAYDVIVIGAGHNGLTTAAFLAKQGRKVLVIERRNTIGGLAAGEEFHPGYHTAGVLHDSGQVRSRVVRRLDLKSHGLDIISERPSVLALDPEDQGMLLGSKERRTAKEIHYYSPEDAWQYRQYRKFIRHVSGVINRIFDRLPPATDSPNGSALWDLFKTGFALRRLGKSKMLDLMRIAPMCVADWLNEWFDNSRLKAALAGTGLSGNFAGPWSPGSAFNLLLWECAAQNSLKGGPCSLIAALEKAVLSQGAEIRTAAEANEIRVDQGQIKGVMLKNGELIEAAIVAASCDPRHTFLDLLPGNQVENRHESRIQHIRGAGTTAKVNLALNGLLEFKGRTGDKIAFARTGHHLDHIEQAFDACKYGLFSTDPILDIHIPTVSNPDLAPAGHSVVSILVHFVPYRLQARWDREQMDKLGDTVVNTLEQYVLGLSDAIVARQVLSPVDLEQRYGLVQGHILHGEHALDQLILRPTPECARYHTPIKGLYLCGSGSHPGGGITCGPGALAASVIAQS
ncbi:MAG: NAD(P)/FAD-dependent oxidoreductase [Deltaproteobacteria bacterium]|jgi:phytoene dehydrogenase-like protein|nr:NAD(P)/FAD-dependent oxidoreductase [Deltaproteobacteria bacterium]